MKQSQEQGEKYSRAKAYKIHCIEHLNRICMKSIRKLKYMEYLQLDYQVDMIGIFLNLFNCLCMKMLKSFCSISNNTNRNNIIIKIEV